ncbi:MAG: N-formylglutamate amidohydrolase [Albidovulum sp.]
MTTTRPDRHPIVTIENPQAAGPFVIVCEHASNHFPAAYGSLGLNAQARKAHIAWDPGALGVARHLARLLDAPLVTAGVSRLIYDLNRPPDRPGAMAPKSEVFDIPGNAHLTAAERKRRVAEIYVPFHTALHGEIARLLAGGTQPVIVTVHSFTPVWHGQPRAVEFGVIHDADPAFAEAVLSQAQARTGLTCRLNEPYSAADGVTHTLRLQATPYGLHNVMLEIRNDLIADDEAEGAMAEGLAPVLATALARITATDLQGATA